ncbi:hypothetical protein EFB08_22210 [Rufibacter latericius]|uniref:Uncharacterized protein n=1 Tax=Rufibacter latericius TaxID=2487040 RepID=A0A3M9MAH4_9BACT|nr:hypothetical protein EFB08_22210 [Rufibacter latericius]
MYSLGLPLIPGSSSTELNIGGAERLEKRWVLALLSRKQPANRFRNIGTFARQESVLFITFTLRRLPAPLQTEAFLLPSGRIHMTI